MKKTISFILSLFMLLSLTLTACAADNTQAKNDVLSIVLQIGNPNMTVNGTNMPIDEQGTTPVIINSRTLLPVRAVVEQFGGSVSWNNDTHEVSLKYIDDEIRLTIDSQTAYLNEDARTLDVAPSIINGRTMLPIRFIAESFNFGVNWDKDEQKITLTNTPVQDASRQPEEPTNVSGKALVVYFSATGNTKSLAEKIAKESNSDIFEIVPEQKYTSADLNYNSDCRANQEQNDPSARPAISSKIENINDYDTVFIGYPIWWGTMPKIINTFLDTYDLSGKTVMPFCTSGSSSISSSVSAIKTACPGAEVKSGFRGTSTTTSAQIQTWLTETEFNND